MIRAGLLHRDADRRKLELQRALDDLGRPWKTLPIDCGGCGAAVANGEAPPAATMNFDINVETLMQMRMEFEVSRGPHAVRRMGPQSVAVSSRRSAHLFFEN